MCIKSNLKRRKEIVQCVGETFVTDIGENVAQTTIFIQIILDPCAETVTFLKHDNTLDRIMVENISNNNKVLKHCVQLQMFLHNLI